MSQPSVDLGHLRQSAPAMLAIAEQVSADKWSGSGSWVAAYGRVRRFVATLPCTEAPNGAPTKQKAATMAQAIRTWLGVSNVAIHPRFAVVQAEPEPAPEPEPERTPEPEPEPAPPAEPEPDDDAEVKELRGQLEALVNRLVKKLADSHAWNQELVEARDELLARNQQLEESASAARSDAEEAREELKDVLTKDEAEEKVEEAKDELLRDLEPFFDLAHAADPNRYDYLWRSMDLDGAIMARYPRLAS